MAKWYIDLPDAGYELIEADSIHRDDVNNNLILVRDSEVIAVFVTWGYTMQVDDDELAAYS